MNEERLEAQKLLFERQLEAQRKAKEAEAAVAAARSQSERETNGAEHLSQRRFSGSEDEEISRDQRHAPTAAIKVDDDPKVDNADDAETVISSEFEHDTGAIYLGITDEEHPESHLIMMAHVSHVSPHGNRLYDSNEKLIINCVLDRGWEFRCSANFIVFAADHTALFF